MKCDVCMVLSPSGYHEVRRVYGFSHSGYHEVLRVYGVKPLWLP